MLAVACPAWARPVGKIPKPAPAFGVPGAAPLTEWQAFENAIKNKKSRDRTEGISYLISGTLAVVGGLIGQSSTSDPLERGMYTVFQSIGVASIGYGFYQWKLGDEDRLMLDTISNSRSLSDSQKVEMVRSYRSTKRAREKEQRLIKAVTHGLIAALNIYGATQQKDDNLKNILFFLGGVNTLATVSYTF